jgi:small-conductance mechanosensitive channel
MKPRRFLSLVLGTTALLLAAPALAVPSAAPSSAPPTVATPRGDPATERSTPRRTMETFLRAAHAGDYERAAQCLDLRAIPTAKRPLQGATLARDLTLVLDRKLWIDPARLSDDPEGDPADGPGSDLVGTLLLDDDPIPISLTKGKTDAGATVWLLSKTTVSMIPALYAVYGEHWLAERMPASLQPRFFELALWQWIGVVVALFLGYWGGHFTGGMLGGIVERLARRTRATWDDAVAIASRGPMRWVLGTILLKILIAPLGLNVPAQLLADRLTTTFLIVATAAFIVRVIHTGADVFEARLPEDTVGELASRGVRTQLLVARRIASLVVSVVAAAVVLIQFEFVRSIGMSLLASAGFAGVVLGFAAQKSLAGVIAGIQLSMTQPIRIGDMVVIEQETGHIEEINLTFVVVRTWDDRRFIVPIARFLEHPFQNWTKKGSALLGAVNLHADPTLPIDPVREELKRLCAAHPSWDRREAKLQVAECTDQVMLLRAVVSCGHADDLYDFRCDIREGLVRFLRNLDGGAYLPRVRFQPVETPADVSRLFTEPTTPAGDDAP